jgi:hypothetical protein
MPPEEEIGQGTETGEVTEPVAQSEEETQSGGGTGINPAWQEMLDVLPSSLHSLVTPHLSKWDQNYQQSINKVHSQYEPYKPFIENKVEPDQIDYGLKLAQAMQERPVEVFNALQDYLKSNNLMPNEAPPQNEEQGQFDDVPPEMLEALLQHPEIKKQKEMLDAIAQVMVQQKQAQEKEASDAELEKELTSLREKHGEFDEEWVLVKALSDPSKPLDHWVEAYHEHEKAILAKARQPGPTILPPGGVAPDNQMDLKGLDDKGRRELIVKTLQAAAQQSK